jgi:hypothetical protein
VGPRAGLEAVERDKFLAPDGVGGNPFVPFPYLSYILSPFSTFRNIVLVIFSCHDHENNNSRVWQHG